MLSIVFWKWHDPTWRSYKTYPYTSALVNERAAQVRANLRIEHEIVCITDDPSGLSSSIRTIPLWPDLAELGACYRRLRAFAPDAASLIGPRFVWIDLDSSVLGDLTPLLDRPEPIVLWKAERLPCTPYNGSMVLMTAGARPQVWTTFPHAEPARAPALCREQHISGSDQSWIAYVLGPNEACWTAADGVLHADLALTRRRPEPARIMFFPGLNKPNRPGLVDRAPWLGPYLPRSLPMTDRKTHAETVRAKIEDKIARKAQEAPKSGEEALLTDADTDPARLGREPATAHRQAVLGDRSAAAGDAAAADTAKNKQARIEAVDKFEDEASGEPAGFVVQGNEIRADHSYQDDRQYEGEKGAAAAAQAEVDAAPDASLDSDTGKPVDVGPRPEATKGKKSK